MKNQTIEDAISQMNFNKVSNEINEIQYERSHASIQPINSCSSDSEIDSFVLPNKRQRKAFCSRGYKKSELDCKIINKSDDDISFIVDSLSGCFLFNTLKYLDLVQVVKLMHQKNFISFEFILKKNQENQEIFVVKSGKVGVFSHEDNLEEFGPGKVFGEIGLLHDTPQKYDIKALEDTICWVLDRDTYIATTQRIAAENREKHEEILSSIFKDAQAKDISSLLDGSSFKVYCTGELITRKGKDSGRLYIICEGLVENEEMQNPKHFWDSDLKSSFIAESLVKCIVLTPDLIQRVLYS
jgi:CRP-like cAMP-binding protein